MSNPAAGGVGQDTLIPEFKLIYYKKELQREIPEGNALLKSLSSNYCKAICYVSARLQVVGHVMQ